MERVRAKLKCQSVLATADGKTVTLVPVYDSNPDSENGKFFRYTPSGECKLGIVNPPAAAMFDPGQEYYVDFTPATPIEVPTPAV